MRTITYGLLLVLLLVGSLILLRTLRPSERTDATHRLARLVGEQPPVLDLERLKGESAERLFHLGVEYFQMWRVREATLILERAVAADSTCHAAWLKLVECYANPIVDREAALRHAAERAAATAAPADTTFMAGLRALYQDRDYAAAIAALSNVVRGQGAPSDARYHLALAYFHLGQLHEAAKYLDPLLKEDATVGPVAELSIRRSMAAGQFDRAAGDARELSRAYPEEPVPGVLVAQVELSRGRAPAALEFCESALDLDPRCIPAIMTRACLYAQAGDYESARVSYEKLMLFDDGVLASTGQEGIAFADFLAGDFDDGIDAMDEAIRLAMLAGARRRGLALALRLVDYLCQLGRADAAEGVVERWVTGFGDVPVRLARTRIQVVQGDFDSANDALTRLTTDKDWVLWARTLSIDTTELVALAEIGQNRQRDALTRLAEENRTGAAVGADAGERRAFLTGYAAFQIGDAETAAATFRAVRGHLYGLEFPYHGDPVIYVQSYFYFAESELARGDHAAARESYESFMGYWGEAAWDLDAVKRSREKLEALGAGAGAQPGG